MKTKRTPLLAMAGLIWLVSLALPGTSPAAVSVHGVASSTGEFITTEIYADIVDESIVSHSFKVFYDPKLLQVVSAYHNDAVWYLFDGKNKIPYAAPDASKRGEVIFVGGRLDALKPLSGVAGKGVLLGTIVFGRLDRRTPGFDVSIGRSGQFASFVTTRGQVLEAAQDVVFFEGIQAVKNDQDLDGLGDTWEREYFKDIDQAYYADDADGDGVNNQNEEKLGSDPSDPNSNLRLVINRGRGVMELHWDSYEGRVYTLEASETPGDFRPVKTGIHATPPTNVLELAEASKVGGMFFRVMLEPAETR